MIFAQAICKFNECLRSSIWIDEIPKGKFDYVCVKVFVQGYLSSEHFDHITAHSRNISGEHRENCTNYRYAHNDIPLDGGCYSIGQYIQKSKIDRVGTWGTDLELFIFAKLLKTDIFVYRDSLSSWLKFRVMDLLIGMMIIH